MSFNVNRKTVVETLALFITQFEAMNSFGIFFENIFT